MKVTEYTTNKTIKFVEICKNYLIAYPVIAHAF